MTSSDSPPYQDPRSPAGPGAEAPRTPTGATSLPGATPAPAPASSVHPVTSGAPAAAPAQGALRLEDFEREIRVRPLTADDFDALLALQRACFPGMPTWSREHLASQVRHFPEGQLCVEYEGQIVASSSSLVVDQDEYSDWHDWRRVADGGMISNHDYDGDTLYGIEIMVHPSYRGLKLARRLYDARKRLCVEMDLARIVIGGRIPGYGAVADQISAKEYVERVVHRGLFDPVLTAQVANGFHLVRLIPDYLPSDTESRGYATHLEWANLEYKGEAAPKQRKVSLMRVCAVQYQMRQIGSFEEFVAQCEFFVDTASDYKSDFVLFPELHTTQMLSFLPAERPGDAARRLAELTPRYLESFGQMAIKYNVNIIGGSQFTVEDGRLYNIAYLFRRDGTIAKQPKLHITPAERRWWGVEPGDRLRVFETDRGRIAILICYDVEFPEVARIAAGRGANVLFVPFNTDNREGYLRVRYCAQARAIENHVYTVISGCVGNLPLVANADVHYGQSGILTPSDLGFARDGIAAECTPNIETLVIHDLDVEQLRRHRRTGTVQNWNDRRLDLYQVAYLDSGENAERRI
ncbi:MAG: GNAT family N-acetyltransferase [Planctomycetaceae bacterium]|nr:GNAT family N-acetyltransferase [Planctomycetaceae bacterium]